MMHARVLGGVVIGIASACHLERARREMTLVERRHRAAIETSYAKAMQLSFGYVCGRCFDES
jgi:hypothetical protein